MSEMSPVSEALSALSQYYVGDATLGETLTHVSELTMTVVPQAEFVGLSMIVEGRLGTYVFTHPEVVDIDRAQYDTGDGPCIDSFRSGEVVSIESTKDETRWPKFCRVAYEHGILCTLSLPMKATPQRTVGAMNLYARQTHAFGQPDAIAAQMFAAQAAFLLANAQAYWDARSLSENLETAMKSRAVIEQAKGIIMAALGCDDDRAFEVLASQSQSENIKLRDVATRVVQDAQRRKTH